MMRKNKILIGLILLSIIFAGIAPENAILKSEEHRVSIIELFTATWCHYCPAAETAVSQSYAKNSDKFVFVEYHLSDSLSNEASENRAHFYKVTGTPTAVVNGKYKFIGSDMIADRGLSRAMYDSKNIPLVVFSAISAKVNNKGISVSCAGSLNNTKGRSKLFILLIEDKVKVRSKEYRFVVRGLSSFEIGDKSYAETCSFTKLSSYNLNNLYLLFFVQNEETEEIYNAKLVKLSEIEKDENTISAPKFMFISQDKGDLLVHIILSANEKLGKFELQIAKDKSFSKIVLDKVISKKKFEIGDLPPGIYYSRVRGVELNGKFTGWSEMKTFSVMEKIALKPNNPYMTVNGVKKEIDPGRGTKPVIIPEWGRTVVPIRAIVEALGGTIQWDGKERKVTILFNDTTIELWIDKPQARVNGEMKWIDPKNHNVKPIIINDRTMLPLRFVAENLGCTVNWDPATRTITIVYSPQ